MKILITGCSGFIGRAAALFFAARGHTVTGIDRNPGSKAPLEALTDFLSGSAAGPLVDAFLSTHRPDALIHAAGRASPFRSVSEPLDDFNANSLEVIRLLELLRNHSPETHFIQLSSAAIYGQPELLPILESSRPGPLSPYGYHKWMAEIACEEYARLFGIRQTVLRIFSAYGPGLRRQVIYDMIQRGLLEGGVRLNSTGQETRDFIYISDVCQAINCVLSSQSAGCVYNVASGREERLADIAWAVSQRLGLPEPLFADTSQQSSPTRWIADTTLLRDLGFKPEVDFSDGLRRCVEWCLSATPR